MLVVGERSILRSRAFRGGLRACRGWAARRVEARVAFGRFECSLEGPLDISLLSERFVPGAGGSPPQYETPPVIYSGHRCLRQQYVGTKDGALSI